MTKTHDDFDNDEYTRLANEMNEDSKLQFNLFIFGITTTAALLALVFREFDTSAQKILGDLPPSILYLTPLIVLLPTSLIILNRARTRNRKAAYIIVAFDYRRLRQEGVTLDMPLDAVRQLDNLPWETALHILDRTQLHEKRGPHIPPALLYMMVSYTILESACALLTLYTTFAFNGLTFWLLLLVVSGVCGTTYWLRFELLRGLKHKLSIQGYAKRWFIAKFSDGTAEISPTQDVRIPAYLRGWFREVDLATQTWVIQDWARR